MKKRWIWGLIIMGLLLTLAFTMVSVPVVHVKPNGMVAVRCVGVFDEVILDPMPDGVDVTCRVWLRDVDRTFRK